MYIRSAVRILKSCHVTSNKTQQDSSTVYNVWYRKNLSYVLLESIGRSTTLLRLDIVGTRQKTDVSVSYWYRSQKFKRQNVLKWRAIRKARKLNARDSKLNARRLRVGSRRSGTKSKCIQLYTFGIFRDWR